MSGFVVLASIWLGCAAAGAGSAGPNGSRSLPSGDRSTREGLALREARAAYDAGEYRRAARLADSLYLALRHQPEAGERAAQALWLEARSLEMIPDKRTASRRLESLLATDGADRLRTQAIRRLAVLEATMAEEPAAIRLLLAHPEALDGEARALIRSASRRLSVEELRRIVVIPGVEAKAGATVRAALARALARSGRQTEAEAVAAQIGGAADAEDRAVAREVTEGRIEAATGTLKIGLILSLSGRFGSVGRQILEGARVALEEYVDSSSGPAVELEVLDDSSRAETVGSRIQTLQEMGVAAVLGPIRSASLREAARARREPGLLILSPTATDARDLPPFAYTLWDRSRREMEVAADVGSWMAGELGARRFGVLYPATADGRREYLAFRAAVSRGSGYVVDARAYEPDSTTFGGPITALASFDPEAVFVAAEDARTVLQLGPQLTFFGLRGVIIAGGMPWSDPSVVRRLDAGFAKERIVGTYVDRMTPSTPWVQFEARYEKKYRKGLRAQLLPALGHDAMKAILDVLPADGLARPGAVARAFVGSKEMSGTTGTFRVDPAGATVSRRTWIRVLQDRSLVEADAEEVRRWAEEEATREESRAQLRREQAGERADREAERRLRLREEAESGRRGRG